MKKNPLDSTKLSLKATGFYQVVKTIPKGKVTTYSYVAKLAELTSPRHAGYLLHRNPDAPNIPCHRVVNSRGMLAKNFGDGGITVQAKRLANEGVTVINNRVDLGLFLWSARTR